MPLHGPVLVATDLSDAADIALREAHTIASELGAPLIVCHVLPETFRVRMLFPQEAGVDNAAQEQLEHKARVAVHHHVRTLLGGAAPPIPVEIETGTPHAGILGVADRLAAGVIVVGPGGTALRVARSATGPVLIARRSATAGGILGATDFSDPSLPAVHLAADEARRRGVRLRIIHCLDLGDTAYTTTAGLPGMIAAAPLPQSVVEQLESRARERLAEALTGLNVVAEGMVMMRRATAGILEAAEVAPTALIVVGTRGRSGLARLALGSVAEAVMSHAQCSVLVEPLHPTKDAPI